MPSFFSSSFSVPLHPLTLHHLLTPLFGDSRGVEDHHQFNCSQRGNFLLIYMFPSFFFTLVQSILCTFFSFFPSHLFMLTQEVSKMPISLSTPSRMSLMTSGGMRRERISDRASGLMFPTARFASSTKGYRASVVVRWKVSDA